MSEIKTCFVIAPIGESNSEIRKRSDQVFKHIIAPAASECGYKPLRADQIPEPGIITSQVIQHIINDPLVIADLTGHNPNVFYELAVRHVIQKPIIQIIGEGEKIPFDVAATRTIVINHQDLDGAAEAKKQIVDQIKSITEDPTKAHSPISISIDLSQLRRSSTKEQWSSERGIWVEKVYTSTQALLLIEKDVNEARAHQSYLCHYIEKGVVNLPEQERNQLLLLAEGECSHCKDGWGKIEYHVNQSIGGWQNFLAVNCSTDECQKYTSFLDDKRKELGKEKE